MDFEAVANLNYHLIKTSVSEMPIKQNIPYFCPFLGTITHISKDQVEGELIISLIMCTYTVEKYLFCTEVCEKYIFPVNKIYAEINTCRRSNIVDNGNHLINCICTPCV